MPHPFGGEFRRSLVTLFLSPRHPVEFTPLVEDPTYNELYTMMTYRTVQILPYKPWLNGLMTNNGFMPL